MGEQVIATVVGPGTVIRGELRCAGDLVVHGRIEGAVSCGGALRLEPGGTIEAEVRARSAVLAGRIRGDVSVVEEAELATSCRMLGDLRAARVTIAPGAAVRGRVELGDVGSDDDAAWAAFDDEPDGPALPGPLQSAAAHVAGEDPPASVAAARPSDPQPDAASDSAADASLHPPDEAAAAPEPSVAAPSIAAMAASAPGASGFGEEPGGHPVTHRPPPIPASALALGVRSTVVLKHGA